MYEKLLSDIRNYLDITWEDVATDQKLTGIIQRGISYLQDVAGAVLDFEAEATPRSLLFDYCRYARSNALEMFYQNYRGELVMLRIARGVQDFESTETSPVRNV